MIALIDYGAGNLVSVRKALAAAGAAVFTPATPGDLATASGIVVPGVGHFGATRALDESWRAAIGDRLARATPLLGICLGLQWLFEASDEAPGLPGLGLLPGRCFLLGTMPRPDAPRVKVPHVGWNALARRAPSRLLEGIADGAQAYFTHSYAAPITGDCVAVTDHGGPFASVVERGLVFGVQWHPEKSGEVGLALLRNFAGLAARTS